MKTVKELLNQYPDKQILTRYFEKYPKEKKNKAGYVKALKELRNLKVGESEMILYCGLYGCTGHIPGDDTNWGIAMKWTNFLACKVRRGTLDNLCNALFEITYHGYSERQVDGFWKGMFKHVAKVKKKIDENEAKT